MACLERHKVLQALRCAALASRATTCWVSPRLPHARPLLLATLEREQPFQMALLFPPTLRVVRCEGAPQGADAEGQPEVRCTRSSGVASVQPKDNAHSFMPLCRFGMK